MSWTRWPVVLWRMSAAAANSAPVWMVEVTLHGDRGSSPVNRESTTVQLADLQDHCERVVIERLQKSLPCRLRVHNAPAARCRVLPERPQRSQDMIRLPPRRIKILLRPRLFPSYRPFPKTFIQTGKYLTRHTGKPPARGRRERLTRRYLRDQLCLHKLQPRQRSLPFLIPRGMNRGGSQRPEPRSRQWPCLGPSPGRRSARCPD